MIRKWFTQNVEYKDNPTNQAFDRLMIIYKEVYTRYFDLTNQNSFENLIHNASNKDLPIDQSLFLEWILKKGQFKTQYLNKIDFPNHDHMTDYIEYEIYILKEELLNFEHLDDVRSCIISITNNLPNKIEMYYGIKNPFEN